MKNKNHFLFFLVFVLSISSQNLYQNKSKETFHNSDRVILQQEQYIHLEKELFNKVLSGKLIEKVSEKRVRLLKGDITTAESLSKVAIYFDTEPDAPQKETLSNDGVVCYWETWTPPSSNHPFGFVLADLPSDKLETTLSEAFVKKMDTAEYETHPHNNNGGQSIRAPEVWSLGFDGTGVKVGILDSGLDSFYKGTDLPSSYQAYDYSDYPNTDTDVENITSGHGTHVTGTVLGRGVLSTGQSHPNNGQGAFKGVAPGADLVFFKIGGDESSSASNSAEIAAMDAAVDVYGAKILSMSYGGWSAHHDGSGAVEQKADWVYDQGVPFFISAGNDANDNRHYSGTVAGNSSSNFIKVNVEDPGGDEVTLWFNLVWYDGIGVTNDLSLEYYDANFNKLTDISQNSYSSESTRGTESLYSHHNQKLTAAGIYYLKVVNKSSNSQFFHIYDDWGEHVTFENADPDYTIGSPASADYAFAVGAYVTRETWTDSNGDSWWYGEDYPKVNEIGPFSSRGPRVDGYQKPDIAAPGHFILSLRDTDVYTSFSTRWIDNDGVSGGDANYYGMQGTSMACPHAAGAAALLLQKYPSYTPAQVYSAFKDNANTVSLAGLPNEIWGYGRLDIYGAVMSGGTAPQASTDVSHITIQDGPDGMGYASFVLSNVGNAALNFNITVDGSFTATLLDNDQYVISNTFKSAGENNYTKSGSAEAGNQPKAVKNTSKQYDDSKITGNDFIILDDGDNDPTNFIGWGSSNDFKWMSEFNLISFDFSIDALQFYMQTKAATSNPVFIEVLDNSMNVVASGEVNFSLAPTGDWYRATLNSPINFTQGQTFYIALETKGSGIDYPAGVDDNAQVTDKSYYFSGGSYTNLNTFSGYENGAWLVRAEGTIGNAINRVTVTPENGTIQPGNSETINLTFDASGLATNTYSGHVNVSSNGGNITIPIDFVVDVANEYQKENSFSLSQNYPNPFNPSTTISYSIPKASDVKIVVYDVLGREIKTLVNREQVAGSYSIDFNAEELTSGIYFYVLRSDKNIITHKMILLK